MRKDIQTTIDAIVQKPASDPGFTQNLRSGLQVLGELLSGALDRLDQLEGGGGVLQTKDFLGDDVLKK